MADIVFLFRPGWTRLRPGWTRRVVTLAALLVITSLFLAISGCAPQVPPGTLPEQRASGSSESTSRSGDEFLVVDCLLPGQVRKLGQMTFLTPRRPVKTAAQDCEIRGGEYVAYDRADYRTALNFWLPQAKEGDKEAQTYVGEIYEKGLGVPPDYAVAVAWYRKAAEQGNSRAQINLGHLYEKGLGVEKDPVQALSWYRQASGLSDAIALDAASINTDVQEEVQELRQEVDRWKQASASLRQQLEQTQQQLEQARQELERRRSEAETERQELEQARQELERRKQQAIAARDDAELKRLEAQLQQREADLARQQQEATRLQQEIVNLKDEATRQRTQLAELEKKPQVALPGPTIEIIDPPLVATRGLSVVKVSSEIAGQERLIVGRVTAPAGLLTFTVNDRKESLNEKGIFRTPIPVQRSDGLVKVVAVDARGSRASVEFQLTTESDVAPVRHQREIRPTVDFGHYYALVIGNQNYTHWPDLKTPAKDAMQTAEILSKKYGFKTKLLLNATRYDILQALNELRKELNEKDNLLIYYAGHGHLDTQIDRGYWVPVDADVDSNVNWISTFSITDIISAISAMHVLVVADSCYSGALTRSTLARLEAGMSDEARAHWLKVVAGKRSRTVLSSGDLQPVLDSGGGDHSVFAKAFLDVLTTNAEILEGERLHREIAARVAYAASAAQVEQVPQYAPIRYSGHEAGDFLFVPATVQ
jgi:uncharacterized caspase-like protein